MCVLSSFLYVAHNSFFSLFVLFCFLHRNFYSLVEDASMPIYCAACINKKSKNTVHCTKPNLNDRRLYSFSFSAVLFFMATAPVNRNQDSEQWALHLCVYRCNSVSVLIVFRFKSPKSLEYYTQPSSTNQIHCRIQSTWFPSGCPSFIRLFFTYPLCVFFFFCVILCISIAFYFCTQCLLGKQAKWKINGKNQMKLKRRCNRNGRQEQGQGVQNRIEWNAKCEMMQKELLQQNECILLVFAIILFHFVVEKNGGQRDTQRES